MKIKTQFNLLIAGIILLPFLAVTAQLIYMKLSDKNAETTQLPPLSELPPALQENITQQGWRGISFLIQHISGEGGIVIFSKDLTVFYSTIPEFITGEQASYDLIFDNFTKDMEHFTYSFETLPWIANGKILLLFKHDNNTPRGDNPIGFFSRFVFLMIIVIILFALIMSFIITNSIKYSITIIEKAARRIAQGELNVSVNAGKSKFLWQNNEITALTASLNHIREELKEEDQRRSRFIMGITHDLKTPLALIKGYTEAISDGIAGDPEAQKKSLEIIACKTGQLEDMINSLIDFITIDSGKWRGALNPQDIGEFLKNYAARIESDAGLFGRHFESEITLPPGTMVPMDANLVTRAIENLIGNAIRYTKEGDNIKLAAFLNANRVADNAAGEEKSRIIVEVRDSGPGISREDMPHVFEMFYRGSASRREQGMGLGLSIVKGAVESHGWTISVSQAEKGGTVFRISIP